MVLPNRLGQQLLAEVKKYVQPKPENSNQLEFDFVSKLDKKKNNFVLDDYTEDKVTGLIFFQDALTDTGN